MHKDDLPINANICEVDDGPYYPVRLEWIPRPGDLIDLFSFIEQAARQPPQRHYEVVQVVHTLHDVFEGEERSYGGHHFVSVFVKPAQSGFLK